VSSFFVLLSAYTINTSNNFVSRNDVPFLGPENKISHCDPIFQKTEILGQFLTGPKITAQKGLTLAILTIKLVTTLNSHLSPSQLLRAQR